MSVAISQGKKLTDIYLPSGQTLYTLQHNLQMSALLLLWRSSTVCLCSARRGQGSLATAPPGPLEPQGSSVWTHPMAYGTASAAPPPPPLLLLLPGEKGHRLCQHPPPGMKIALADAGRQLHKQGGLLIHVHDICQLVNHKITLIFSEKERNKCC